MFNYNGYTCDKCGETFKADSDIVVCPECGTPHHRECYNELGHCVNEDKHGSGFEWKAPVREVNNSVKLCSKCQTENPKDASFCENCGFSLAPKETYSPHPSPIARAFGIEVMDDANSIPKTLQGEIDGVSYRDMAVYIGPSAPYYIFNFKRKQREGKKFKNFCWSAFLFEGLYFLYRKMWGEAIAVMLLSSILSIPSVIMTYEMWGLIPADSPLLFNGIETAVLICTFLSILFKIFLGFIAVNRYEKKVIKDIKNIQKITETKEEYYQALIMKSGPSRFVIYIWIPLIFFYLFL